MRCLRHGEIRSGVRKAARSPDSGETRGCCLHQLISCVTRSGAAAAAANDAPTSDSVAPPSPQSYTTLIMRTSTPMYLARWRRSGAKAVSAAAAPGPTSRGTVVQRVASGGQVPTGQQRVLDSRRPDSRRSSPADRSDPRRWPSRTTPCAPTRGRRPHGGVAAGSAAKARCSASDNTCRRARGCRRPADAPRCRCRRRGRARPRSARAPPSATG